VHVCVCCNKINVIWLLLHESYKVIHGVVRSGQSGTEKVGYHKPELRGLQSTGDQRCTKSKQHAAEGRGAPRQHPGSTQAAGRCSTYQRHGVVQVICVVATVLPEVHTL